MPSLSTHQTRFAALVRRAAAAAILCGLFGLPAPAQPQPNPRDGTEQPAKVIEATGIKPGMVVGEIGAGSGYFTFWLSQAVGHRGKVYANDILPDKLATLDRKAAHQGITNIETVVGTVDDPRFPRGALDMVFMINSFHEFEKPQELLANLLPSLKPGATVVIMDRDPSRSGGSSRHYMTRKRVEETVNRSVFEIVRVDEFLPLHNLYILKARTAR